MHMTETYAFDDRVSIYLDPALLRYFENALFHPVQHVDTMLTGEWSLQKGAKKEAPAISLA